MRQETSSNPKDQYAQAKQKALSNLTNAIAAEPNNWELYFERAQQYLWNGNYVEAMSDYTYLIDNKMLLPKSYTGRGQTKYALGEITEALKDFNLAIASDPKYMIAYHLSATTSKKLGKYEEAIGTYDQIISIDPDDYVAYHNRGIIKEQLGNYQEGILDFTKSIEISESKEEESLLVYYNRGNLNKKIGDKQGAIHDFTYVANARPRDKYHLLLIGQAKRHIGAKQEAIEDFTKLIDSDNYYTSSAYLERAITKSELGDLEGALEDANKSVKFSELQKDEFDKAQALELIENIKLALL
jgi:tetratricopeptide (TPR) repeat protein